MVVAKQRSHGDALIIPMRGVAPNKITKLNIYCIKWFFLLPPHGPGVAMDADKKESFWLKGFLCGEALLY